jgi:hypothetical protein
MASALACPAGASELTGPPAAACPAASSAVAPADGVITGPAGTAGPDAGLTAAPGPVTAAIVPGTSIEANRDHAPVQPSGVSGHHSSGWACGAAACQMP